MSDNTAIEWASLGLARAATWNPIRARNTKTGATGHFCEKVSAGCDNCYSERLNLIRFGTGIPFKPGHRKNGDVELYLDEDVLTQPLRWRLPRGIFPCSMTDMFGKWVPDEWIDRIFAVMALAPQHRFAVLTKRSARMRAYLSLFERASIVTDAAVEFANKDTDFFEWPLKNVWVGVSVENQPSADERIPDLEATPAAVRWCSYEPAIGPIDGRSIDGLDWLVAGCESGPGARDMPHEWAREVRDKCRAAGTAFFMKQLRVGNGRLVKDIEQFPPNLRVREFPE